MEAAGGMNKPTPLELTGNVAQKWRTWLDEFEIYMEATDGVSKPEKRKTAMFLNLIGKEAREVYHNFPQSEGDVTLAELTKMFEKYCMPRKNTMYNRFKLWSMSKKGEESVDQFAQRLLTVARDCNFGDQQKLMVRDRIVFGMDDDALRERILEYDDLPLEKILNMVRASETSKQQAKMVRDEKSKEHCVEAVSKKQEVCDFCGLLHMPRKCPAYGRKCNNCGKLNHFATRCRSRDQRTTRKSTNQETNDRSSGGRKSRSKRVNAIDHQESDYDSDQSLFVGILQASIAACESGDQGTWFHKVRVHGREINFKLDSGAEVNVLPKMWYEKLHNPPPVRNTGVILKVFGGQVIKPTGKVVLTIELLRSGGAKKQVRECRETPFVIADVSGAPILGLHTCVKMGLIARCEAVEAPKTLNQDKASEGPIDSLNDMMQQFPQVFTGIGCYQGEIHLHVDDQVHPVIHAPRRLPVSVQVKVKRALEEMTQQGIIQRVDYPTPWVNSMVVTEKTNGQIRICLDPRDLNRALRREHYKIPTFEEIMTKLEGMQYFTVIDQKWGFWNIKLDEESANLCTFNTPFGRFRFNRLPFGISVAPEIFQSKNDKIFGDIPGVGISTDDFIIGGRTKAECMKNLKMLLLRAVKENTKFNTAKIQFGKTEVKYLGRIISGKEIKIDPEKIQAIKELKPPTNKSELRSMLGMVTYLTPFIPALVELTHPFRDLMKQNSLFSWDEGMQQHFQQLKEAITHGTTLTQFSSRKPITIQADASQHGLGGCVMQDGKPIAYTSRRLTDPETRYAQIEKEFLAVVNACEHFHYFIYGLPVTVETDHKPLLAILEKPLDKITHRMQRFVMRLQRYRTQLVYKPGKTLVIADYLSRNCCDNETERPREPEETIIHAIEKMWNDKIQEAYVQDEEATQLLRIVQEGWPEHREELHPLVRRFWTSKDQFREEDNVLMMNGKIFVPGPLRNETLELLHSSHLGIEKTKNRARKIVYWPGMNKDIEGVVSGCEFCRGQRNSNSREPLLPHPIPERPWQKVGMDFFELEGDSFLLLVDYWSKFPEVIRTTSKSATAAKSACKAVFARHGIPEVLISDNMPFGSDEFRTFCEEWGIKLTTCSPRYPQSNGLAEKTIQTIKKQMKIARQKKIDPELMLLELRNTPITGLKYSPAQLLMNRQLRSKLPTTKQELMPTTHSELEQQLSKQQQHAKKWYDRSTRVLKPLQDNQQCWYHDEKDKKWQKAKVKGQADTPRSWWLQKPNGILVRRNRKDIMGSPITGESPEDPLQVENKEPIGEGPPSESQEAIETQEDRSTTEEGNLIQSPIPGARRSRCGRAIRNPSYLKDYIT